MGLFSTVMVPLSWSGHPLNDSDYPTHRTNRLDSLLFLSLQNEQVLLR